MTHKLTKARLALAERIISKMMETTDAQWDAFNKATGHVSRADKVRQGAAAAGKRFDNVTNKAKKAGDLIRKRADGQTTKT